MIKDRGINGGIWLDILNKALNFVIERQEQITLVLLAVAILAFVVGRPEITMTVLTVLLGKYGIETVEIYRAKKTGK